MTHDIEGLIQRINELEKALLDADSWLQAGEGVPLEYYHGGYGDEDSVEVIIGLKKQDKKGDNDG